MLARRGDLRAVVIADVQPELDGGRTPIKRVVGEVLHVSADVLREGHGAIAAVLRYRAVKDTAWRETPMVHVDNDRWAGHFTLSENTRYLYGIEAWPDPYRTWARDLEKRLAAGMDAASELLEGMALLRGTLARAAGADRRRITARLDELEHAPGSAARARLLLDGETADLVETYPDRTAATRYDRELEVVVDRPIARCAAWYELFPRSQGRVPGAHGTFLDVIERLPDVAAMGFDVVYFPPIHPIGRTARKGPNNRLTAGPGDPGSPWAIGNEHGGHKAVEPALGTLDDFRAVVRAARELGLEIALDYALQCSPDHPWVTEHPEWFHRRPDGSIKFAENPPKQYQDIYPLDFACRDREALWDEARSVLLFWIEQGVRTFRVDNPHTKPLAFWAWVIREVQTVYPDTVFLAEAFTRPKVMQALAKAGFTQSYTYFTWRTFKDELTAYLTELTEPPVVDYLRGNLFVNTPDILPPILQEGGPPAFRMRVALAATLSPLYGIYSGYELYEREAVPGTEEYLDSEKYEIVVRDWKAADSLAPYLARLNRIRRAHPAFAEPRALRFFAAEGDHVLFYGRRSAAGGDVVWIAVNLDPFEAREAALHLPLADLGLPADAPVQVHDLITDRRQLWRGPTHRLRLAPDEPAAIFHVTAPARPAYQDPCS